MPAMTFHAAGREVARIANIDSPVPSVGDTVQLSTGNYLVAAVVWDIPAGFVREIRVELVPPRRS